MDDVLDIMELFKSSYPSWKDESVKSIYYHIYPSIALQQYTVNKDADGEIYGYTNWAFLNESTENKFLEHLSLDFGDWKTGDKLWIIDSIYKKEHNSMKFNKTFFTHLLGVGKTVNWLRLAPNGYLQKVFKVTTKKAWL
jgi:hemolysin-activating ACP:hemolysin acyltransferase|tara:strand:- start:423 stop:839 length:417 start_codon:yes stop_codon:yes gene_type:complete